MTRVSFTDQDGKLRWFDPDTAKVAVPEGRYWDGNNWIGVCSLMQTNRAVLYLTGSGRWIENADRTREFNGPDSYQYLTHEEAQQWLMRSADAQRDGQEAQAALDRYFGEIPEESGPGRPEVGGAVHVRLGEQLPAVDAWAAAQGINRAEAVRRLVAAGLGTETA